ncbi:cysteine-rich receptor-like protein kinase 8, partial [Tanacetum coccineum]
DENPIRTLGDYSKPSHEGYRNTIELPEGNNVVPLRSDTIWLVQNGCSFHELWSEDPNQHLKDFLKLVDSLNINSDNRERMRLYYSETFSPIAKISSMRLFISLAVTYDWSLHQLNVKNAFLHGDLQEVYMEQPPGFVAQGESGRVFKLKKTLYGLKQSPRAWFGKFSNANPEKYGRVVGKLNYLTISRPDISFLGTPGLGILYANHGHHKAKGFTYDDYAGCPNTSRSTTGYCVFVKGNLVSWKNGVLLRETLKDANLYNYRNTIELPKGNNVVPLRSDTIWLVQNGCSFHELWSEDPNQHLKDFLKLVDSLDINSDNRERTRLRRIAKLCNDILMFQQHQGESLSKA